MSNMNNIIKLVTAGAIVVAGAIDLVRVRKVSKEISKKEAVANANEEAEAILRKYDDQVSYARASVDAYEIVAKKVVNGDYKSTQDMLMDYDFIKIMRYNKV